jgi:hypothetical protein
MSEVRRQRSEDRELKSEFGLRPGGAIGAYAPEGRRKVEKVLRAEGIGNSEG